MEKFKVFWNASLRNKAFVIAAATFVVIVIAGLAG